MRSRFPTDIEKHLSAIPSALRPSSRPDAPSTLPDALRPSPSGALRPSLSPIFSLTFPPAPISAPPETAVSPRFVFPAAIPRSIARGSTLPAPPASWDGTFGDEPSVLEPALALLRGIDGFLGAAIVDTERRQTIAGYALLPMDGVAATASAVVRTHLARLQRSGHARQFHEITLTVDTGHRILRSLDDCGRHVLALDVARSSTELLAARLTLELVALVLAS